MKDSVSRDIDRWTPNLLTVWRRRRRYKNGPSDHLLPHELGEVVAGVKTLSAGLTGERQLVGKGYMDDPLLLGAYLLFYWPVSYAHCRYALGHLSSRPRSVLDLGSGPAPMSFASLDHSATEVIAADRSDHALKLALELAGEAGEPLSVRKWDPLKEGRLPEGIYDLIAMGHLLNELWAEETDGTGKIADLLEHACGSLQKNGALLVIEPALLLTSRRLLEVRDLLVNRGFPVLAPCIFRKGCPALKKEGNTCHTDRFWEPPRMVKDIARLAGLNKDALKMSFLILAPKGSKWPELPEGRIFRIVSEPLESNKRLRLIGCGQEGRVGLSLQEKDITGDNKVFLHLKRGDIIRITGGEDKESGITITDMSRITVMAGAGRPLPIPWE